MNPNNLEYSLSIIGDEVDFLSLNSTELSVVQFDNKFGEFPVAISISDSNGSSNIYPTKVIVSTPTLYQIRDFDTVVVKYLQRSNMTADVQMCKFLLN